VSEATLKRIKKRQEKVRKLVYDAKDERVQKLLTDGGIESTMRNIRNLTSLTSITLELKGSIYLIPYNLNINS
jgi:hypothetical protein